MALCLVAGACEQKTQTTSGQEAKEYLDLFMKAAYPDIQKNADGIYILEDTPGTGEAWDKESAYILADVTIRALGGGTVTTTTDLALSQQLGTYVPGYYYGPKWMSTGEGYSYAGIDAMLNGMRVGGTRKAVIPAWMLTTSRLGSEEKYLAACTSTTHLEYTLGLKEQTADIDKTEKAQLDEYVRSHYGAGVQPVSFVDDQEPDGKFYFISDVSAFADQEPIKAGETFKLNYTGKLLSGQVFDTTVKNTTKDAGIYQQGNTYSPVDIVQANAYDSVTMSGGSGLITGFKGALYLLKYKGQKATVLFTSTHGYGSGGRGSSIPGFAPLIFELEVVAD